jgi:hypothetical protein
MRLRLPPNSELCQLIRKYIWDLLGEFRGRGMRAERDIYLARFQTVADAAAFALKLRRTLLEARWPPEVLHLPHCGPHDMPLSFQSGAGPRLQMLVDLVRHLFPLVSLKP